MTSAIAAMPATPALDYVLMRSKARIKTINSEPVRLFPLIVGDTQLTMASAEGVVQGLVWWAEDARAPGGRRVIHERVETDVVTGGSKTDNGKADGKPVTYFEDVYMRRNGKHTHAVRRYADAEEQTISVLIHRGGNSMPEDMYLKKGMHFCTPEEYVPLVPTAEANAKRDALERKARDPKRDISRLADLMADAINAKRPAGNVQDAMAAAAEEDRLADEAARKTEKPVKGK